MTSALVCTNVRTAQTLETFIDLESLRVQDAGSKEAASVTFDLEDLALAYDLMPEDEITLSAVGAPSDILFGGFVRGLATHVTAASGRVYSVTAYDYSTLLDRINVIQDDRAAGESDKTRLGYLMTTYGSGLLSSSDGYIATLNASMPAQKFRLLSLRQAIEQVLGTALPTAGYRITAYKMLETWDTASGLDTAPYDVILGTPSGGQIAPEAFEIATDTSGLYNAYWVRGATAAGSGWFTNATSIAQWGRREKFIDAPDSDLAWKASNVGLAALVDTKDPKYRGTMTVRSGDWRSDQRFLLTSVQHGLTAAPFDTVRVSRSYVTPAGLQVMDIEFGSPKGSFTAKHGKEARRADGTGAGGSGGNTGGGGGGAGDPYVPGEPGCGCNTPYTCTSFDDFGRSVGAGWGTSTDGHVWEVYTFNSPTDSTSSVTSGSGRVVAASAPSATNQTIYFLSTPNGNDPWTAPAAVMLFRIRFNALPPADAFYTTSLTIGIAYGDSRSSSIAIGSISIDEPNHLFVRAGAASFVDLGLATAGAIYAVKIDLTSFAMKMWLDGTSEPAYQSTSSGTTVGLSNTPIEFKVQYFGHQSAFPVDTISLEFLDIDFGCPDPSSGQPVPRTLLGTGNGASTTWGVGGQFRPGSLAVDVDGVPKTPVSQSPTTGEFTLGFAATTSEHVYASWVAA